MVILCWMLWTQRGLRLPVWPLSACHAPHSVPEQGVPELWGWEFSHGPAIWGKTAA